MGIDTGGNQTVDFVWGNLPIQPDTLRVESAVDFTTIVSQAVYDPGGYQAFFVEDISGLSIGDTFEITNATPYSLNTSYVISDLFPSSPSGGVVSTPTPNGLFGTWTSPVVVTLTKSASGNIGGGANDKGWAKTTKKKSVKLNPALDSHEIAVNGLRGYPGFGALTVPNVLRMRAADAIDVLTAAGLFPEFGAYDTPRPDASISPNFTIVNNVATMTVNPEGLPGIQTGDTFYVNVDGVQIEQQDINAPVVVTKVSNNQLSFEVARDNVTTTLSENQGAFWSTSQGLPGYYGAISRTSPAVGTAVEPGSTVTYYRFND